MKALKTLLVIVLIVAAFIGGVMFTGWKPVDGLLERFGIKERHTCPTPQEPPLTPDFEIVDNGDGTYTIKPKGGN